MKQLEGKKAGEIYYIISNYINKPTEDLTDDELNQICLFIKKASGEVAWVIYLAKSYSWWNEDIDTTCKSIKEAAGDVAYTIYCAKHDGWWNEDDETTCQSIRNAPGDVATVIYLAKQDGWWIDNDGHKYKHKFPNLSLFNIMKQKLVNTWKR